jgi:hypothetical protein
MHNVSCNKYKVRIHIVILLSFSLFSLSAQQSVHVAGGNSIGSDGSVVSYTIGQVVCSSITANNGSVLQGVQQPYEISVVTSIEDAKNINLFITTYPNPTTDYLTLKIEDFDISNLSYQLYDINGKLLQNQQITSTQTSIVTSNLVPAAYFVRVIQENKEIKIFKIIKH